MNRNNKIADLYNYTRKHSHLGHTFIVFLVAILESCISTTHQGVASELFPIRVSVVACEMIYTS